MLYACGRGRAVATGTVAGWLVVMVTQTLFAWALPEHWKIAGMALGMSVGMTVGGVWLLVAVAKGPLPRQAEGDGSTPGPGEPGAAVAGLGRAVAAAVLGGGLGFLAGRLAGEAVFGLLGWDGTAPALTAGLVSAVVAGVIGLAVAVVVDRDDARALAGTLRRGAR